MFQAKARIQELLWKYLDAEVVFTTGQTALEINFYHVCVGVAEQHVLGFDGIEFLLLLLALLNIAM